MKCPDCDNWVPLSEQVCSRCGCDLTVLMSLAQLRESLMRTRTQSDAVVRRLREMEEAVAALEPIVADRLESAPKRAPAGESPEVPTPAAGEPLSDVSARVVEPPSPFAVPPRAPWTPPSMPSAPRPSPKFGGATEVQLGQKWLLIAGLVSTILAVGYFLKYSFDRNWVGPAGRVALAYLGGVALLGVGETFRRREFDLFGLYLIGGGIAVMYFASYAAFQIYHLIGQPVAFALMVVVTIFAGALCVHHDTKWLAVLGIIGGFVTPIVLSTGNDNQIALMTYMAVLSGGILAVAAFKQWHLLNYLGLFFTWSLFTAWYDRYYGDDRFWITTVYLNVFFLAYTLVPFVFYFVRRGQRAVTGFTLTIPNTLIAFGFSFAMIRSRFSTEWVSAATLSYAALFVTMAYHLYRRNRENIDAFTLLLAKGMLFLIVTVPILFSEHWITIFWAVQGVALLWAGLRLNDVWLRFAAVPLLLVAGAKFAFLDYAVVFDLNFFNFSFRGGFAALQVERWVTTVVVLAGMLAAGRLFPRADPTADDKPADLAKLFSGVFGVLLFAALNIEVAAASYEFAPNARFAAISVLWALFAAALMGLGFARNAVTLRRCAIGLFAVTILKVFIRDMASVSTPYRILSFLVVGLLLVAVSYLYHRFAARILPPADDAAT